MTWPVVISKLAEIGLDDYASKLKAEGFDDMSAFDASDKEALSKIADMLELKAGHKAKFIKKFSEEDKPVAVGAVAVEEAKPAAAPAINIVMNTTNTNTNENTNTNNNGGGPVLVQGDLPPSGLWKGTAYSKAVGAIKEDWRLQLDPGGKLDGTIRNHLAPSGNGNLGTWETATLTVRGNEQDGDLNTAWNGTFSKDSEGKWMLNTQFKNRSDEGTATYYYDETNTETNYHQEGCCCSIS